MDFTNIIFLLSFCCVQGKAIGVGIGCILGMFPLLFFKDDDEKKEGQKEGKEKTHPPPAATESSKNWNCQLTRDKYYLESVRILENQEWLAFTGGLDCTEMSLNSIQSNQHTLHFAKPSRTVKGILKRILDIIWL